MALWGPAPAALLKSSNIYNVLIKLIINFMACTINTTPNKLEAHYHLCQMAGDRLLFIKIKTIHELQTSGGPSFVPGSIALFSIKE